jgi:DNA-binding response OmpR family regulator
MNVLIVEDEKKLAEEIQTFLTKEGYLCEVSHTGREASQKIYVNDYDFVLLDLGLPDYEGLDILQEAMQEKKETAFIIVTARGEIEDKVKGFDLGADDYLPKPFSLLELNSRMQAITRRKHGLKENVVSVHDVEINATTRKVNYENQEINLTKKEFDVLWYLVLHKNRVVTRYQLLEHIWGTGIEDDLDSNHIDVHIKNLRKKVSQHTDIDWLETVRGIGYRVNL